VLFLEEISIEILDVLGEDWRTVLRYMGEYLVNKGYAKESYIDALLKREENYPTGIEIPFGVNVAIPHAEVEHVLRQALIIGVPNKPVIFHNIEEPEDIVEVDLILLLVINNPDGYLNFLSNLTLLFQEEDFIRFAKEKSYRKLANLIIERCLKGKKK